MPQHITKQPNGKYAIFSSVVDDFVVYDATPEECYEHFRQQAVEESDRRTKQSLDIANQCKDRFGKDIDIVRRIHGDEQAEKRLEMMQERNR